MAVQAVVFDWGGVLIEDPAPGMAAYLAETLGVSEQGFRAARARHEAAFYRGLSEAEFWQRVGADLGVTVPARSSLWQEAFRSVYKETELFPYAADLQKRGYKTGFLSNTELPNAAFFEEQGYDMFDALVFSCREKLVKPEAAIFDLTLERLGTEAAETVFIDDREEYITAVQDLGWHGVLFKNVKQVQQDVEKLLS